MTNDGSNSIKAHPVVSHEEWLSARTAFLAKEKDFTRLRDELSRQRRGVSHLLVLCAGNRHDERHFLRRAFVSRRARNLGTGPTGFLSSFNDGKTHLFPGYPLFSSIASNNLDIEEFLI